MIDWQIEWPEILAECERRGPLDPCFIAAIRFAENGGPGREYGILAIPAPDRASQLRVCARTILTYMDEYPRRSSVDNRGGDTVSLYRLNEVNGRKRLVYSAAFIAYVRNRYCPIGAANDPGDLNSNWFSNVNKGYARCILNGPGALS